MALVNRSFSVNVTPGMMPPIVHVSEYDVGRAYTVSILDEQGNTFTIPSGTTASIEGTLNGSVGFTQSATVSNNQVSFTLSQSMTAYSGKAWCKIKLTLNNQPIQTCAFVLAVDRAGVEADTVIGAPGFEEQIQQGVADYLDDHQPFFTLPEGGQSGQALLSDGADGAEWGDIAIELDATLSHSGEAADAKAVGDRFGQYFTYQDGGTSYNLLNLNDANVLPNKKFTASGTARDTIVDATGYSITGFIPVVGDTWYCVHYPSELAPNTFWVVLYNANGEAYDYFSANAGERWAVDANGHPYMKFKLSAQTSATHVRYWIKDDEAAYCMFVQAETMPSVYQPYGTIVSGKFLNSNVNIHVDDTLTQEGKPADAKAVGDRLAQSDLSGYFTTVTETIQTDPGDSGGGGGSTMPNLLNPNDADIEHGKTINESGNIVDGSGKTVSGYIPVSGGGVWYAYHYPQNETQPAFLLYNASKQYVDYWQPDQTSARVHYATDGNGHKYLAFKLSDGSSVRYLRIATDTAALGVYAMFVQAETMPNTYVPYSGGGGGGGDEPTDPTIVTVTRNALKGDVSDLGGKRIRLTMERGTFASGGKPSSAFSPLPSERCRTAYFIKTNGATSFSLLDLGRHVHGSVYVEYYNSSMTFISESSALTSPLNITIPNNAAYLKFVVVSSERIRTLDAVFYGGIYAPEQVKNNAIWGASTTEQILFDIKESTYGCARLALPSAYSVGGAPVPLIVYAHGSGVMNNWNQEITSFSINKYFCDEGFALLEIFGWDNEDWATYGNGTQGVDPYPIPYWLRMYEHAVDHVCNLYNIDRDNIHVLCKSQGGQLAYYYASNPPAFPIRSISMFAPVLDYFSMDGLHTSADSRRVLAREMGFDGNVESDYVGKGSYTAACKAFFELNIEKFNGLNEAWNGLVGQTLAEKYAAAIDNGEKWWANKSRTDVYQDLDLAKIAFIPVKIWCAVNDDQTPYQKCVEAVDQLNNGGTEAHMRTFQTGGHAINTSTGEQTANVTAANGVVWSTVPTCLVEAVQWMRQKMPHGG